MYNLNELVLQQKLKIRNKVYTIVAITTYVQGSSTWKSYELVDSKKEIFELEIEATVDDLLIHLFKKVHRNQVQMHDSNALTYQNEHFDFLEKGQCTIQNIEGISPQTVKRKLHWTDYLAKKSGNIISVEDYRNNVSYYFGKKIERKNISLHGAILSGEDVPKLTFHKMSRLTQGQYLKIRDEKFYIAGSVWHNQKNYRWKEYKLIGTYGKVRWFAIDPGNVSLTINAMMSLHEKISSLKVKKQSEETVIFNKVVYTLSDKGNGTVSNPQGKVDYDPNESFTFYEYTAENDEMLTKEIWEDGVEWSHGFTISEDEIEILDEIKKTATTAHREKMTAFWMKFWLVIFGLFVVLAIWLWSVGPSRDPIEKQLIRDPEYILSTHITLNDARQTTTPVFTSYNSVPVVIDQLIEKDPEKIKLVTTTKDVENPVGVIITSRETIVVYPGESDAITYVQTIPKRMKTMGVLVTYFAANPGLVNQAFDESITWRDSKDDALLVIDPHGYKTKVSNARSTSIRRRRSSGGSGNFGK